MADKQDVTEPTSEALDPFLLDKGDFVDTSKSPHINAEMQRYYGSDIELFPETDKSFVGIRRFYDYYSSQIEAVIPIDGDIQRSIKQLERKVRFHMIVNVLSKRVLLVLVLVAIFPGWYVNDFARNIANPLIGPTASVTYIIIAVVFVGKFLAMLFAKSIYDNQVKAAASLENAIISDRLSSLSSLFKDLLDEANQQKQRYKNPNENPVRWSNMADWMVRCAIWTAMRVEYIERYFQTRMWRVRRTHRLIVLISRSSAYVLLAAFAYLVTLKFPNDWKTHSTELIAAAITTLSSIYLFRTPPNDIKDRLNYSTWKTFRKLKMHEEIARHIAFDKSEIWIKETNQ